MRKGNGDNSIAHSFNVSKGADSDSTLAGLADNKLQLNDIDIKFVFIGTGTSTGLPHAQCYLATNFKDVCKACKACFPDADPKDYRNKRANTGAAMRIKDKKGKWRTVLIDCGKGFKEHALPIFRHHGMREIDGLLITHSHADAIFGIDDLRDWTDKGPLQLQKSINIYATETTIGKIKNTTPWFISSKAVTGNGAAGMYNWIEIKDMVPFQVGNTGIMATGFSVYHGKEINRVDPLLFTAYNIANRVVYISDVSTIPKESWTYLKSLKKEYTKEMVAKGQRVEDVKFPILVLDCLNTLRKFNRNRSSHFNVQEAVAAAQEFGASVTYLTGFGHSCSHSEAEKSVKATQVAYHNKVKIRCAYDSLCLLISSKGEVTVDSSVIPV